jgi:hypothetical protein
MQKILLLLGFITLSVSSISQNIDLVAFEKQRVNYTKKSMLVLGGWSAANMIGSAFATKTSNQEMRYFHQMNVQWNGINLLIASLGYWGASKKNTGNATTLASVLQHQNGVEKTYLINLGLDVAYVTGGLYLTEKSKSNSNRPRLKGYGNAIMVQGGFLLLYDIVNYAIHRKHGKQLDKVLEKIQLTGAPGAVAVTYNF